VNPGSPKDVEVQSHGSVSQQTNRARYAMASCNPDTDPSVLHGLSMHSLWRVRAQVAANPSTDLETLTRLAFDPVERVRRRVVSNPNVSIDILQILFADKRTGNAVRAMAHRLVPVETLTKVLTTFRGDPNEVNRAARALTIRAKTQADVVDALTNSMNLMMFQIALGSPLLDAAGLRKLAKSPAEEVQFRVATHPRTPADVLTDLAMLRPDRIRIAVANHASCSNRIHFYLARKGSSVVRLHVAKVANQNSYAFRRLSLDRYWFIRAVIASRTSNRALLHWYSRSSLGIQSAVATNPHAAPPIRQRLAQRSVTALALTSNPILETVEVEHLRDHPSPWVRGQILAHPEIGSERIGEASQQLDRPAWELRRLAMNPLLDTQTRENLLTWLSIGGAIGDATFDPLADTGHIDEKWYADLPLEERDIGKDSAVGRVRAVKLFPSGVNLADFKRLSKDPSPSVRERVARFTPLPSRVASALCNDPVPWVSLRARAMGHGTAAYRSGTTLFSTSESAPRNVFIAVMVLAGLAGLGSTSDSTKTDYSIPNFSASDFYRNRLSVNPNYPPPPTLPMPYKTLRSSGLFMESETRSVDRYCTNEVLVERNSIASKNRILIANVGPKFIVVSGAANVVVTSMSAVEIWEGTPAPTVEIDNQAIPFQLPETYDGCAVAPQLAAELLAPVRLDDDLGCPNTAMSLWTERRRRFAVVQLESNLMEPSRTLNYEPYHPGSSKRYAESLVFQPGVLATRILVADTGSFPFTVNSRVSYVNRGSSTNCLTYQE
jgi:Leucine rich repeat variant